MTPLAAEWNRVPGYLNAATMGLPPLRVVTAMEEHLGRWKAGECQAGAFDDDVRRARCAFGRLVGTIPDRVAIGAQVSALVGLVASSLPAHSRVVVPEDDFTSVVFPFLVHRDRGIVVEQVPRARLAESIHSGVDWVAFSLVQSSDGTVADIEAIHEAATAHGARTLADLTQAAGWLPVRADDFDVTVTGAYKWLCAPRGSAFMTLAPDLIDEIRPLSAGWYAGEEIWSSIYGPSMQLATSARRFDISPGWPAWVGTAPAIELFADADPALLRSHGASLADLVRAELGLAPRGLPVLSLEDPDGSLQSRLQDSGCAVAARAGAVRVSFHIWNDGADAHRVINAVG
ncbi:aminotransferase class V-fold PLP-dependent enzyme [Nocardioides sp.]|uniref:aminotransferase class V-fold PLP-dependent enzyme n=1 Tax=Nocardioides sp. TaxID=35761 RepID=UPI002C0AC7C1|nr:aminotransferase class V-fold PLP-dependent enzyme [Nocardioides sp.]HSX67117.1 aminotransferase class V-fold PLP-dependent enzyme [Nocardioides sp.]